MSQLHVICQIAGAEYAVAANEVFQMETFSEVTPVPGAPSYVAGLVQVRQQIIPVVDARKRFGLAATVATTESRLVVLKLDSRLVGLLVDSAREVQNIKPEEFHAAPEMLAQSAAGFVKSVAQVNGRIIMLIDAQKVVGEETKHG